MKKKNCFFCSISRLFMGYFFLIGFLSCVDDESYRSSTPGIGFRVDTEQLSDASSAQVRASDSVSVSSVFLFMEGNALGESVYLHTWIKDGIGRGLEERSESVTRAAPVTSENMYDSFGSFTYVYEGSWNGYQIPNYMYNVEVTKSSNWSTNYYWPGAGKQVSFFAYSPYNGQGIALSSSTESGGPRITYTVPSEVSEQHDLLGGKSGELSGSYKQPVPLLFKHLCCAVQFKVGANMLPGTITDLSLKNVYGRGIYDMDEESWSGHSLPTTFTQSGLSLAVSGLEGDELISGEETFMMLPQVLPSGSEIELSFCDSLTGISRTLRADLSGSIWPMGKTVTYKLSTTSIVVEDVFDVIWPQEIYPHSGETKQYSILSHKKVTHSGDPDQYIPKAWTAAFFADEALTIPIEKPDWLADFTSEGTGDEGTASLYNITVSEQGESILWDTYLKRTAPLGTSAAPYDLSTKGGTELKNTANCYLINAPGTYKLPLVYGNAFKNGVINESAYKTNNSSGSVLKNFLKHNGQKILGPNIDNINGVYPDNACLVAQDASGLISDVSLCDNNTYLKFTINPEEIKQGNAIVAVRDVSNTILWSWHIWTTYYQLGSLDVGFGDGNHFYTVAPYPLGYYHPEKGYASRAVWIRFIQIETNETKVFRVYQKKEKTDDDIGQRRCCFYQWGRKDPMPGKIGWIEGIYPFSTENGLQLIDAAIRKPNVFIKQGSLGYSYDWCSTNYLNLWDMNQTATMSGKTNPGLKTVYDPSPIGYMMPPDGMWGIPGGKSGYLLLGYRYRENGSFWDDAHDYWSSTLGSLRRAFRLEFPGNNVQLNPKSNAYAVRPIQE